MEPTTTAASGFALSKVYLALPALFMSLVAYFLRKSKSPELAGHGRMATGAIVGGIAVGSSVIFGGALIVWLGFDPNDANTLMFFGGCIGLASWTVWRGVIIYLDRMDGKDIVEIAQEVKGSIKGQTSTKNTTPRKKPARKTTRKATK